MSLRSGLARVQRELAAMNADARAEELRVGLAHFQQTGELPEDRYLASRVQSIAASIEAMRATVPPPREADE